MTDLYLYQTIHLARGEARNVSRHIDLLDTASQHLFGRGYVTSAAGLRQRLESRAAAEHFPMGVSGFLRLELTLDGEERIRPFGISLYDGYGYRSLTPRAATIIYDLPFTDAPTSVRESLSLMANWQAHKLDAEVAIRCDSCGRLISADDAPLFAIRRHTVFTSPAPQSVERELTIRALRQAGLTYCEEAPLENELDRIEELFYTDHRGITSLSHCNGRPLMTFLAERVALALEALFPKK